MMDGLTSKLRDALEYLHYRHNGSALISSFEAGAQRGMLGDVTPGLRDFHKLERLGLVYITEEEPVTFDNGYTFDPTPSVEISDLGYEVLREKRV